MKLAAQETVVEEIAARRRGGLYGYDGDGGDTSRGNRELFLYKRDDNQAHRAYRDASSHGNNNTRAILNTVRCQCNM